ncbi:hypothetical protein WG66_016064 [Moniliophthora roreri]|uniref:Uncharacterized protein n=1 Tax=Moniliophthora roreri TaxID=221103 RepID=A0A0W0FX82_MONRR|nr:hypothetical protein WG66_016064 [Moniliophthora roreri]
MSAPINSKRRAIPMIPTRFNSAYQGSNGFTQLPQTVDQQQEAFDHAMNILRFQSLPAVSVDDIMSKDWSKEKPPQETTVSIRQSIQDLKKERAQVLSRIYDLAWVDYCMDQAHREKSHNELLDMEPQERKAHANAMTGPDGMQIELTDEEIRTLKDVKSAQAALSTKHKSYPFSSPSSPSANALPSAARVMHSYAKRIINLQRRAKEVEEIEQQREYNIRRAAEERKRKEDEERRRQEERFPVTAVEWKLKKPDYQRRVAHFFKLGEGPGKNPLTKMTPAQEKCVQQNHWDIELVQKLMKEYEKDESFQSDIMVTNTQQTRDPRKAGG